MVEEQTRIEKLIPDYGKLNFANKEEKLREDELSGFSKNEIIVWRQLDSQAHMANEQLEKTSDIFQSWLDKYKDVQDMVVVQKALNVINTFGRLLLVLDSERQFLLKNIKKVEIKEVEVEVEKSDGKKIREKDWKRIALCLCGEMGFESGKKGRGKLGTYREIGNQIGKNKKTIETWIEEMIKNKYVEKIIKNLQEMLKEREKTFKNDEDVVKDKKKIIKNDEEGAENKIEPLETPEKVA